MLTNPERQNLTQNSGILLELSKKYTNNISRGNRSL